MRDEVRELLDYLADQGFRPKPRDTDPDDIVIKSEGKTVIVSTQADDPKYVRLIIPNFWSIESEAERGWVTIASARINRRCKGVKVFAVDDDTWATLESFYPSYTVFQEVFERSLSALHHGVRIFREEMNALRKESEEEV